jgi:hypothetical protein
MTTGLMWSKDFMRVQVEILTRSARTYTKSKGSRTICQFSVCASKSALETGRKSFRVSTGTFYTMAIMIARIRT